MASKDGSPGGDRVVVADTRAVVLDASTDKPWDPPEAPDGVELADVVAAACTQVDSAGTFAGLVEALTSKVREVKAHAGIEPRQGGGVVLAAVDAVGGWVARCGDVRVLVDGAETWVGANRGDRIVAEARRLVISSALLSGASRDDLAANDPGRDVALSLLEHLASFRNVVAELGYAVIDGTPVPEPLIDVRPLPPGEHEVVLATDGYPEVLPTLEASEQALAARLRRDPLMIDRDGPATKGLGPGARSFDDRAYCRVQVDVRRS